MKNGKKICWNYRKGRCRFGSACNYAHDSDIVAPTTPQFPSESTTSVVVENIEEQPMQTMPEAKKTVRKKRPGLSNTLVPNKRVIKMYSSLKN